MHVLGETQRDELTRQEMPRKTRQSDSDSDHLKVPTKKSRKRSSEDSEESSGSSNKRRKAGKKAVGSALTEQEKRTNHIESEKKRRQNIKEGFDQVTLKVPALRDGGTISEAAMLQNTYERLSVLVAEKQKAEHRVEAYATALNKSKSEIISLLKTPSFNPVN